MEYFHLHTLAQKLNLERLEFLTCNSEVASCSPLWEFKEHVCGVGTVEEQLHKKGFFHKQIYNKTLSKGGINISQKCDHDL